MNLETSYLGLKLAHPFVAGAGPLADTVESAKRLEEGGAAAIVMRSLFQEQLDVEALATHHSTENHAESFGEALSYFADPEAFVVGPDEYLEQLRRVKEAVDVPVFASLSGYTLGGWLDYARAFEQAGADALELNLYYVATDIEEAASSIEARQLQIVREVRKAVRIPLSVKLSPFYTALPHFARGLERAGANGMVLFNRFFEADLDIEELGVRLHLQLSDSRELLLRLRWLAILSAQMGSATLAVTGGVHTAADAIKAVMAGASAVQMVSSLLKNGPEQLGRLRREMAAWMEEKEYASLAQMRGSLNLSRCPDPKALSRANYIQMLQTWAGD
jgi:dihydroorotate dehydrogenase (fumarate)